MNGGKVLKGIKKIAVLRANGLGDFIFALPALTALKQTYPEAAITYLGLPWHQRFLNGRPGPVDRVIAVPRCNGIPHENDRIEDPLAVERFFSDMQDEQFDIAFQMHGGGSHSNPFVQKLGAKLTVGLQAPGALPLDINVPYYLPQNEILRYLEVAACTGAQATSPEPVLNLTREDQAELRQVPGTAIKPYAILHPGASNIHRRWAPAKFSCVGDALAEEGLDIVITGSGSEAILAEQVMLGMRHRAQNMAGRLSVNALAALIGGARLVVSNDTGPLHLARSLKTPNVGIFWAVNAITAGVITGARNRLCIAWNPWCPACGKNCLSGNVHEAKGNCRHEESLVNEIEPDEVICHALDLLAAERERNVLGGGTNGAPSPLIFSGDHPFHNGCKE